ncbi:hypothetical protein NL676_008479 [Syzygium grande]|nr:hypothetical protein NL676_008479 [Syzygium grande]
MYSRRKVHTRRTQPTFSPYFTSLVSLFLIRLHAQPLHLGSPSPPPTPCSGPGLHRCRISGRAAANHHRCSAFFPVSPSLLCYHPPIFFVFRFLRSATSPRALPSNPTATVESLPLPPDLEVMLSVYGQGVARCRA